MISVNTPKERHTIETEILKQALEGDAAAVNSALKYLSSANPMLRRIMQEPPVRYFIAGEDPKKGWGTADIWPLLGENRKKLFFDQGASGTAGSVNDGKLLWSVDKVVAESDDYKVDYSLRLGSYVDRNKGVHRGSEVDESAFCAGSGYPDLSKRYDVKSLTFTSEPLEKDLLVVGHPLVEFWMTASTKDADVFVVLEEVETDGSSRFVTDNAMRAYHRTVNKPPFNNLGLPWLGNYQKDISLLSKQPVKIALDLKPIGNRFDSGNRIRVTIAGADTLSGTAPWDKADRTITLYRGPMYPSFIDLPLIESH